MSWIRHFGPRTLAVFLLIALAGCFDDGVPPLQVGSKAPPFVLALLDGGNAELAQPQGEGHVLTFMSSWCPCSNDTIPLMKRAHADYEDKGIAFLMIGIQDAEGKFENFVAKWGIPFPAGYDSGDRIARAYGVNAPPTTIFIDRDGIVKRIFYGNIKDKEEDFRQWTRELLG
jgi:peroxiredoxin